jgi:AcrR family transcriptional regulator
MRGSLTAPRSGFYATVRAKVREKNRAEKNPRTRRAARPYGTLTKIQIRSTVRNEMPRHDSTQTDMRNAILDVAEALLARYGYRKTTMDDIAREARIGKGTTYLYFASKEDVFLATIDRIVDRLCARLREIGAGPEPLAERLGRMLAERVLYRFDCVSHYPESLDGLFAVLRPAYLARRATNLAREADVFAEALASAVADPRDAAEALLDATNALLPYGLGPRELGDRDDVARRVARIARPLVRGVLAGDEPNVP